MLNLSEYKIIKYFYTLTNQELTKELWDKMTYDETRWVIKLTLGGVNESSEENGKPAWDIFFIDPVLENDVNNILLKYNIEYVIEDLTEFLINDLNKFDGDFIKKLNSFLDQNLTVDDVLDNIIEVGMENISIFEKYYLTKHKYDEQN